jgi:hypothetical protein
MAIHYDGASPKTKNLSLSPNNWGERVSPAPLFKDYERRDAAQRQVRVDYFIISPLTFILSPQG